jgi:uncharacterized protein (TIGR02145 family)
MKKIMKKIIFLVSITCLMLQSCSSGDSDNNTSTTSVSDVDGNVYQTVTICNQTWTKTNLNVSKYRNGDVIPQVQDATQWASLTTGAWCYYLNNANNGPIYGKLYNWYAINDPRGIAPIGWHIPSENEVTTMINCLGGWEVAGGKMKSVGTSQWASPNLGANNNSGFTALPGGGLNSSILGSTSPGASFSSAGLTSHWWTSTSSGNYSINFTNNYNLTSCYNFLTPPNSGFSVRCIKD